MNRRNFLALAGGMIVVPQFGRFFRQGSGLLVPAPANVIQGDFAAELNALLKEYYREVYPTLLRPSPLLAQFRTIGDHQYTGRQWVFGVAS